MGDQPQRGNSVPGRRGRRLGFATLAGALCALTALALAGTTSIDAVALRGAGPTKWDPLNSVTPCELASPAYTPVEDGSTGKGSAKQEDAFDGGLVFGVGGFPFTDSDGAGKVQGQSLKVGPANTGGRETARVDTAKGRYLRSLIKIKDTGTTILSVRWTSDLGSDGDEEVRASSSGDQAFTKQDRWVVSSLDPPIDPPEDPPLLFVLHGKGDVRSDTETVVHGPGFGCVTIDMIVKLRKRLSYLLFFTEMRPAIGKAKQAAEKYDHRQLSDSLLRGLDEKVRNRVLNWDL
ncbi:MAG: hypothetical protein ABI726_02685 [bacterium]